MNVLGQKLSLQAFKDYLRSYDFGSIRPNSLVIHHTWSPTKAQWQGAKSIQGLKSYYESQGWTAGPHLFIAEDGIWLFTPMKDVGIHAGEGNATWRTRIGRTTRGFAKPWGGSLVEYSIGIEVVGNYDAEKWSGETKTNSIGVIKSLMDTLGITTEGVYFHRDFSKKSCPGWAITKEWLGQELVKTEPVLVLPTKKLIQVRGRPEIHAWTGKTRHYIPTMATLEFFFPGADIEPVDEATLNQLPEGVALPPI